MNISRGIRRTGAVGILIPFFGAVVVGLLWWGAALTDSRLNYAIAVFVVIPAYIFWFRRSGNSNRMTTGRSRSLILDAESASLKRRPNTGRIAR